jgi:hypothetical protein
VIRFCQPTTRWVCCLAVLAAMLLGTGCNRAFYRRKADADAYSLLREKTNHPHWPLERVSLDIDPSSRMFDPFNPDRPPMPPDDPVSHQFMHYVDGKKGYPRWHANGDTPFAENPHWKEYLPLNEDGVLTLNSSDAVRMALIHSSDYQSQFETLYLSALDVSTERFRFDNQFFGGYSTFYNADGRARRGGGGDSKSNLNLSTFNSGRTVSGEGASAGGFSSTRGGIGLRKGFTTGADLIVGFANTLMWNFSGTDTNTATTLMDFAFIQPLLRQAGRDRVLETLTLAERVLLANVRQMERYRRSFYVQIMTGRGAGQGPSRRGGFFGASGLEGFSGVGVGGFGRVGGGASGGGGDGQGGGGTGAAQAGGYIGLLQIQQDIRNQQANIAALRSNLTQLRETLNESLRKIPVNLEDPLRQRLQIAQAQQALYNAESRLLNRQNDYQSTLDSFKFTLGLPPKMCLKIDDPMLDQFNLLDTKIVPVQNMVTELRERIGLLNQEILADVEIENVNNQPQPKLAWTDELETRLRRLRTEVSRIQSVRDRLSTDNIDQARTDIQRLQQVLPRRREQLIGLREKYHAELDRLAALEIACQRKLTVDVDPLVFDVKRLEILPRQLQDEHARLTTQFDNYRLPLEDLQKYLDNLLAATDKPAPADLYKELETKVIFAVPEILTQLSSDVLDLSLMQARARADSVELQEVDLPMDAAFDVARRYRRDWMNNQASLVDAWRLIEFNADNLESTVNVVFTGDIGNTGNNPIRLRSSTGRLRAGLQFDAPFVRLQERNTYRQSLIEYQQARRGYYRYVDGVSLALRGTLRTIEVNRLNFEERRLAVLGAIEQIVLNNEIAMLREQRSEIAGVTAARDAVSALTDLLTAQNDFLSVWVNYEVLRRFLDLDLGTMQLDSEGLWIDPGKIGQDYGSRLDEHLDGQCVDCVPDLFIAPGSTPELIPPGRTAPEPEREELPLGIPSSPETGLRQSSWQQSLPKTKSSAPAQALDGRSRPKIVRISPLAPSDDKAD